MVVGLLSHPKRQFYPSENNMHLFYLDYEKSRWQFTNEKASRITLHRTDTYWNWCPWINFSSDEVRPTLFVSTDGLNQTD